MLLSNRAKCSGTKKSQCSIFFIVRENISSRVGETRGSRQESGIIRIILAGIKTKNDINLRSYCKIN
jgi:hypothetical protein